MGRYLRLLLGSCIVGALLGSYVRAQISYQVSYHAGAGNPGGINTEQDFDNSGWTIVMMGGLSSNQWSGAISLPFTFNFFDQNFNSCRVSANGLLTFGSGTGGLSGDNSALPSFALPNHTIACFWEQFTTSPPLPLNDVVQAKVFGTAPHRQYWIRWASYEWGSASFVYLAAVLEESTGNIYLVDQYSSPSSVNLTTTVGVQQSGNLAVQAGNNIGLTGATSAGFDNSYYQFEPFPIPPEDITPLAVLSPQTEACGTGAEQLTIRLQNQGQLPATNVSVGYSLNGVTQALEVVPGTIAPGATTNYTFNQWIAYPTDGTFELAVWGSTPGDSDNGNDTMRRPLTRVSRIASFPYQEDFENGTGGWSSAGSQNSWDLASPNKSKISGAVSGSKAWVTGATGSYQSFESSHVISPCFDFSNLGPQSQLSMWVWWECESPWDGTAVQSSIDGGQTWQILGQAGPDWYNSNYIGSLPGGQPLGWSGTQNGGNGSGGWRQVSVGIPSSLRGQPEVRIRVVFAANGSVQGDGFAFDRVTIGDVPQVNLGPDGYYCPGHAIDAGNPGMQHQWSTGHTGRSLTLFNPGPDDIVDSMIAVTVTNSLGLSSTDTIRWSMAAPLQAQVTGVEPITCHNAKDGQISTDITGGRAPFLVQWSGGKTGQNPTGMSPGWYTATVTDVDGCTTTIDSTEVTQPEPLQIQGSTTDIDCHGAATGGIQVTAQGGNGGYQWAWTDGPATANRSQLAAGTYEVALRDAKNCSLTRTFTLQQQDSIEVQLSAQTDALCPDGQEGQLEVNVSGGTAPYAITWSNDAQGPLAVGLSPGTYTLTVEDSLGCVQPGPSWEIAYQDSAPEARFGYTVNKNTVTLQDSSHGATGYLWDFGDGSTSTLPSPMHQYSDTGQYWLTLLTSNGCGTDTAQQWVSIIELDTVNHDTTHTDTTGTDTTGTDTTGTDSTTGIFAPTAASAAWELYPNPNPGRFTLRLPEVWLGEQVELMVYNTAGQLVERRAWRVSQLKTEILLNANLPPGYYQIWLRSSQLGYGKSLLIR